MKKGKELQTKKALSAVTPKALLKIIPSQNRNESMRDNSIDFENNQDIPSNPRKGVTLDGFISCFYILRVHNNAYKVVCCFLDENTVKKAYQLIKKAFPTEKFYISDEIIDKKFFNFWGYARKHIKSLKKVNQLIGYSNVEVAA